MDKDMHSAVPARHVLGRPVVYRLGTRFIGRLPRAVAYWGGARIADISYLFCTVARNNVKRNLRRALPHLDERGIAALALSTFRNYSGYLVDYGVFKGLDAASLARVLRNNEGDRHVDRAVKRGRGIIVLTVHIGNWELGGIYFAKRGLKINVVTAAEGVPEIDELKREYRRKHNINTVILGDSPFSTIELLAALKRGEVVAMLVDRYGAGQSGAVVADFFDRPCNFPKGPLLLAKMTGAVILPAVVIKEAGVYRSIIGGPVELDETDDAAFETCAREILKSFEATIRLYPDQWYNFVEV
ncbi:MAG: lysophospholipid acyltransferase family protein [Deltaproteobacteria bacterium]|nr:lysophospholipid acyltransferase family protein [Deltaproteobacteria bacterium]